MLLSTTLLLSGTGKLTRFLRRGLPRVCQWRRLRPCWRPAAPPRRRSMRPSPAGDGTKGGSQAGASTDKAQIAFLMCRAEAFDAAGMNVVVLSIEPERVECDRTARPSRRPEASDCVMWPVNSVPRGKTALPCTSTGAARQAWKWSPARLRRCRVPHSTPHCKGVSNKLAVAVAAVGGAGGGVRCGGTSATGIGSAPTGESDWYLSESMGDGCANRGATKQG